MISVEALQSAISNVSVWRQGDVCAPHKPMLLLYVLSQYKAGHPRLFNYGLEIHEPLTRLLKEFGPKRRTDYPNMPFWRLRTDGFWEIANAEGCKPRKGNTQPTKKELIDNQVVGGFDEAAYQQLLAHPEMIDQLTQQTGSGFYRSFEEPRSALQRYRSPSVPFAMCFLRLRPTTGWCAGWY